MKIKQILYHLLLNYSLKELIDGNIYFLNLDYRYIKKQSDSILKSFSKQATKSQMEDIKRLLNLINKKSQDLDRVSWEIIAVIAINWLVNEECEIIAKNRFMHLPILDNMDILHKSYKADLDKHCDFFEAIVENMN